MELKKSLFIVENDEIFLSALTFILKDKYILYSINNLPDFMRLAEQVKPNLVLIEQAVISGSETNIPEIRKLCSPAKMIIMSRDKEDKKLKEKDEVDGVLIKPFNRTDFVKQVKELLE